MRGGIYLANGESHFALRGGCAYGRGVLSFAISKRSTENEELRRYRARILIELNLAQFPSFTGWVENISYSAGLKEASSK